MKIISRKGNGGFGVVDVVEYPPDTTQYALKTFSINQPMPLTPALALNVKKRFIREAQIQSKINHPNIVKVLSMNITADPPCYLMELADSALDGDLSQSRLLNGNYLSVIMDILAGLEELHSMAITHRDLKPQNVLRFGTRYAISDFGLISLKETQLSVLTGAGMAKGSDCYTAPEITADLSKATAQSDIFSVGCILHDMVGTSSRVPCSEINETGEFSDIIRCCTRVDPNRRFSTVSALREALLTVDISNHSVTEPKAADLILLLEGNAAISHIDWNRLVNHIEDNYPEADSKSILRKLSHERIIELIALDPALASRLGQKYSEWAKNSYFVFSECDGIADRLEVFMGTGDANCSVEVLLALLIMGTDHNRWHVERKFANICTPALDPVVAKRFSLELRILDSKACRAVEHLEKSITTSRNNFHPYVIDALNSICKP